MKLHFYLIILFTFSFTTSVVSQNTLVLPFSQKNISDSLSVKNEIDKVTAAYRKLYASGKLNLKTVYIEDFYGIVGSVNKKPVHVYYYQEQFTNWGIYDCYYDENLTLRLIVQNFYKNGKHNSYYAYFTAEATPMIWVFNESGTYEEDSSGITHHSGEKLQSDKRYSFVEKTTGQPTIGIDIEAVRNNSKQFCLKANEQ